MAQEVNAKLQVYLVTAVYIGTASSDLTTNIIRGMKDLAGSYREMTARFKGLIGGAGTSN